MKKYSFYILFSLFVFAALPGQSQSICIADPSTSTAYTQSYSASSRMAGKGTSSPIMPFNFSFDATNPFYVANKAGIDNCIDEAKRRWSNSLTSPDISHTLNITVHLYFQSILPGHLMGTDAAVIKDCGNCGITSTLYAQALANFREALAGHTGNFYSSVVDITTTVNTTPLHQWSYDLSSCPPDRYDFTSVLTHEIAHGLGFTGCVREDQTSGGTPYMDFNALPLYYPGIFDQYVTDNNTGHTTPCPGVYAKDFILWYADKVTGGGGWGVPSGTSLLAFDNYCNGLGHYDACDAGSNSLFFAGSSYYKLYIPRAFENGSSMYHLDGSAGTELMEHATLQGHQLTIGSNLLDILKYLGWDISSSVGGSSNCISLQDPASGCTGSPNLVFNLGVANSYCYHSVCSTSVDPSIGHWSIGLYDKDGVLHPDIITQTGLVTFSPTINASDLPSGVTWYRDINNRIAGILSYNNGSHYTVIGIGINYQPQSLNAYAKNSSDYWCQCDKETIHFYAPGATSYQISKRAQFWYGGPGTPVWSHWLSPVTVTADKTEYTFSSLTPYDNYQFQVTALNANGTITSSILTRNHCANYVFANPNPIVNSATLNIAVNPASLSGTTDIDPDLTYETDITDASLGTDAGHYDIIPADYDPCGPRDIFYVSNVTLTNVSNPEITYSINFDGSTNSVQINTQNMQTGVYAVTVTSSDGITSSTSVEID